MRNISTHRRRRQGGNAFIEFAIVSLILIPMSFGIIDYSRVFYYASVVQGAARAGTQYAEFQAPNHANTTAVQAAATADTANIPSAQNFTATASYWCRCANANPATTTVACTSSCTGSTMQVFSQVNTQLVFNTIFQYPVLPTSITLNGKSVVRVQ